MFPAMFREPTQNVNRVNALVGGAEFTAAM